MSGAETNFSSTNAIPYYPVTRPINDFPSTEIILTSQTFNMKINKDSSVKKLGQINQLNKQFVNVIIQQYLYFRKFCSFVFAFTILERFIEGSIKMKIHGPDFLFHT